MGFICTFVALKKKKMMTIKDAVLKSLEEIEEITTYLLLLRTSS